ncbi:hypothetical protein KEM52_004824, partial [Ascosphaera acerosa]
MFPGQDFNDARIQDFNDVQDWEQNDVNRFISPRMGWSDCSVSLSGPVVEDLRRHFVDRWNFIYTEKYQNTDAKVESRVYMPLLLDHHRNGEVIYQEEAGDLEYRQHGNHHGFGKHSYLITSRTVGTDLITVGFLHKQVEHGVDAPPIGPTRVGTYARTHGGPIGAQICRSACPWSAGIKLEHSIQNAYARIIL